MHATGPKGTICVTASDLSVKENAWFAPCYAAAKAGLLHFVWTMAEKFEKDHHIRLCALCPARADTPLVQTGYFFETGPQCDTGTEPALTASEVAEAGMVLLEQPEKAGRAMLVESSGAIYALQFPTVNVHPIGSVKGTV
ncbi:hypothetical protein WJX84_002102 [Apatococcus fuscideae]|uniref:Short-chain dehydrogenase n=1 Tax=Apatococcus fuscideae TaxID=2026836 RepID=A0AAW1SA23_9CHLO